MDVIYISLIVIFVAFGAFCFNLGHRRAYGVILKGLLRGQLEFLSRSIAALAGNRGKISQEELARTSFSYETIGQLVIGWYKYFGIVRDDRELRALKGRIKQSLEDYLSLIEAARIDNGNRGC